jgi:hypothetical protein
VLTPHKTAVDHESLQMRVFAKWFTDSLDASIERETRNSDEELALRKYLYERGGR